MLSHTTGCGRISCVKSADKELGYREPEPLTLLGRQHKKPPASSRKDVEMPIHQWKSLVSQANLWSHRDACEEGSRSATVSHILEHHANAIAQHLQIQHLSALHNLPLA